MQRGRLVIPLGFLVGGSWPLPVGVVIAGLGQAVLDRSLEVTIGLGSG